MQSACVYQFEVHRY